MLDAVRGLVDDVVLPNVMAWDRDDVLPQEVLDRLGELGVPGALVPREYGGPGLPVSDLVEVWRTLSQGWISIAGAINTTALATTLLLRHGTDAQRERWLPGIASGAIWASFSITEPGAGSDLRRLSTWVEPEGKGYVITGEKRWIAGGLSFPLAFVLAKVKGMLRPSCVVLPADGRGTDTWEVVPLDKLGYRGVESAAWHFHGHHAPARRSSAARPGPDSARVRWSMRWRSDGSTSRAGPSGSSTAAWCSRSRNPPAAASARACSATTAARRSIWASCAPASSPSRR